MSRGTIILVLILVAIVIAIVGLASVDTKVAPGEVRKDMLTDAPAAK